VSDVIMVVVVHLRLVRVLWLFSLSLRALMNHGCECTYR
jgi:hypothetical protein